MSALEIAKRRRAETRRMSSQWDNGEITLEQIKAELIKKYKALSLIRHRNF